MTLLRWLLRRRTNVDLAREIDAHIAERVDDLVDDGLSEADARAQARREFGNRTLQIEHSREVWTWRWLDVARASFRDAFRTFRRSTGTITICLVVLGVSTGMLAATVVVGDALVVRPLRLPGIDRVVTTGGLTEPGLGWTYNQWWGQAPSLERVSRWTQGLAELATPDGRFLLASAFVEPAFPDLFQVRPLAGRALGASDFQDGLPVPIVINETIWTARFERDASIIGTRLTIADTPVIVVGVLPELSAYPHDVQLWIPRRANAGVTMVRATGGGASARLAEGATIQDARNDIQALADRLNTEHGAKTGISYVGVFSLLTAAERQARPVLVPVIALLVAAIAVVGMAMANTASLLLGLIVDRRQELAVRASLGAARHRITGQIAIETTLVGAVAGVCGGLSGVALLRMANPLLHPLSPYLDTTAAAWTVVGLGVAIGCLLGLVVGLVPLSLSMAWQDRSLLPHRVADRGSRRGRRLRTTLVLVQVAAAMMLLTVAGVAIQTFVASNRTSLGFDPDRVLAARLMVPAGVAVDSTIDTVTSNARASGLLESFSTTSRLPLVDSGGMLFIGPANNIPSAIFEMRPDFFATMGIPILDGRDFTGTDTHAAIVSQTLAARLWPHTSAVGQWLDVSAKERRQVIGVAADMQEDIDNSRFYPGMGNARFYRLMPIREGASDSRPTTVHLVMRCVRSCDEAMPATRSMVEAAGATVMDMAPLQTAVEMKIAPTRMRSTIAVACAWFGLLLATMGIYGAVRRVAATRTQEMTIRMALGATSAQARSAVYRYSGWIVATGIVIGSGLAWSLLSSARPFLYGVTSTDPLSYIVAACALVAGGLLAVIGPARRLGRLDARRLLSE